MKTLIAGVSLIGMWKNYKPAFYRLYYENKKDGRRSSMIVLSKLGFLAVAAGLAYAYREKEIVLTVIAPLSLIIIDNNEEKIDEIIKNWPQGFTEHIVKGINSLKIYDENNIKKIYIDWREKTLNITVSRKKKKGCNETENKIDDTFKGNILNMSSKILIIVKEFRVDDRNNIDRNNIKCINTDSENNSIPALCTYNGKLYYDVIEKIGDKDVNRREDEVNVTLSILVVPNNIAVKLSDKKLIILRERETDMDMNAVLRASMFEALFHGFLHDVIDKMKSSAENDVLDIILFYDTTHGINTLIAPFTSLMGIIDSLVLLKAATLVLERMRGDTLPYKKYGYSIRSYVYNSDPVPVQVNNDVYDLLETTWDENVSYYYRRLLERTEVSLNPEIYDDKGKIIGEKVRAVIGGARHRMAFVKGVIDELVSMLRSRECGVTGKAGAVIKYIVSLYLAKLGLYHWVVADALLSGKHEYPDEPIPIVRISKRARGNGKYVEISYENALNNWLGYRSDAFNPYLVVAGLRLGRVLVDYLVSLYHVFAKKYGCLDNCLDNGVCFAVDMLDKILSPVDSWVTSINNSIGQGYSVPVSGAELVLSTIYNYIVEPSAEILVGNEIDRMKRSYERLCKYYEIDIENLCVTRICGEKTLCYVPTLGSEERGEWNMFRNFIAHGGFTGFSKDWCLAVTVESKGGRDSRRIHGLCIRKPLDPERICKNIALL